MTVNHLLEGPVLGKLGLELLQDLANWNGVVVKLIASFERAQHVSYAECTDCNLGLVSIFIYRQFGAIDEPRFESLAAQPD
jgi:hypothetical protein